jgi:hypothetical protein
MRRVLSGLLPLLLAGNAANASSIHVLPATPSSQTPSIVERGEPNAISSPVAAHEAGEIHRIGPSVIAIGAETMPFADVEIAVADEDKTPAWMSLALPEVIRGGVRGGAFPEIPQAAPAIEGDAPADPERVE